jgi:hypothetical protein
VAETTGQVAACAAQDARPSKGAAPVAMIEAFKKARLPAIDKAGLKFA